MSPSLLGHIPNSDRFVLRVAQHEFLRGVDGATVSHTPVWGGTPHKTRC